ncbi:MAG: tyrosine-type recombinase/integrase [Armatimonadetes bacterium]|nr:tyrosine-type recombinase/integrase [Armatimonadota bacterium]
MKGHLEPQGRKRKTSWRLTIDLGRDENGRRRRHRETVEGTKKDAERRLREIITSLEQGLYVAPSRMTTGQYLRQWAENYAALHTSPRTAASYQAELERHIIPGIGQVPLSELRPHHIQSYYVQAVKSGRTDGTGGLSPRTVLYHHRIISEALEHAVRQGNLVRNCAKLVDPPSVQRTKFQTLTRGDAIGFLEAARGSQYFYLFALALGSGARLGELLALTWRNVDMERGCITIDATLYREGQEYYRKPPKSGRSRNVPLPPAFMPYLRDYKTTIENEQASLGLSVSLDDFAFATAQGKPLDRHSVSRGLSRVLTIAGLPHMRFHDLRHTHASLMLQDGRSPKVVQERLGHASAGFTLDTYGHVMPGIQEDAAARFGAMFGNALPEGPEK